MIITRENKKYYQDQFVCWLEKHQPQRHRPKIMASNVMYTINQGCKPSLNDLISGHISLEAFETCLIERFEQIKKKNPIGHAKVQIGDIKYFLAFIKTII